MGINEIIMYIMMFFMLIAAVDRILSQFGGSARFLGKFGKSIEGSGGQFEEGFMAMGALGLAMVGMTALAPVLAHVLGPVIIPLYEMLGANPSMFAGTLLACDMGGFFLAKELAGGDVAAWLYSGLILGAMDMGSGTLGRLTALMPPEKLDALLLSHWHFDHCSDVLPLLFRLQACAAKPLDVYAPVDESSMVRKMVQQNSAFCLHDVQKDDKVQIGEFSVRVFAARHPVPGVMYRVMDGEKTLCYTGDTNTVEGLTDFAQDADLLLADGLFPTEMWQEGLPHLSAAQTAELARDARVKKLVITHLNPNIDPETLLKQARAIRTDAELAHIGATYRV